MLQYTNENDAVNKIVDYLSSRIDRRDNTYTVLLCFGNAFKTTDKSGYKNASAVKKRIVDAVNSRILTKYDKELQHDKSYQDFYLSLKNDPEKNTTLTGPAISTIIKATISSFRTQSIICATERKLPARAARQRPEPA